MSVGVILPTKDEERWTQDETRFHDAFTKAGYNVQILFSEKDSAKEKANVEVPDLQRRQGHHHLPRRRVSGRGRGG